jgi:short-subunit dehydrogenase
VAAAGLPEGSGQNERLPIGGVYNGTKAFIDSFSFALRNELKDTGGVTVTCLMPGATETRLFERADLLDTQIG